MFRNRSKGREPHDDSVEARLRALGHLLDARGYRAEGLCILAVEDGFVVNGMKVPERGAAYSLAQEGETIEGAEVAATLAQLRAQAASAQ